MKKLIYPDYSNCPVNITNSILKHFNCTQFHPSHSRIDEFLSKGDYKHVILYLSDGLGTKQLHEHLDETSFLRQHQVMNLSSVFPPTTTASTTSILTGLYPNEHGWLGWNMYIKDIDEIVTLFKNCVRDTYVPFDFTEDYAEERFPNHYLHQIINESGNGKGYFYFPFKWTIYKDKEFLRNEVLELCSKDEKNFIYIYDTQPDSLMHVQGSHASEVTEKTKEINDWIESISNELHDTCILFTADHGHLDVQPKFLSDAPELEKMLIRPTSLEARACVFHVKPEYKGEFRKEFERHFSSDEFVLLSSDEVKEMKLFGPGENRECFDDSIGDYLAIAVSDKMILDSPDSFLLKSHHAGLTQTELTIPLILVDCKE